MISLFLRKYTHDQCFLTFCEQRVMMGVNFGSQSLFQGVNTSMCKFEEFDSHLHCLENPT